MNWTPVRYPPPREGHYLVAQENSDHRRYMFVRYWNGSEWNNPNEVKYGEVLAWMHRPSWPNDLD
jgi:hypothetical protein